MITATNHEDGLMVVMKVTVMMGTGGGVALLYAGRNLDAVKDKLTNFDQQVGVQIVQSALKMPLKTIADNAGMHSRTCTWLPCMHMRG